MQGCCCRGEFCKQYSTCILLNWCTKQKLFSCCTPPTHAQALIMIIQWLCILHASHAAEEWRGALRGLATVGPPAEMRGKVRAKERGVWRRLTNRIGSGNRTNHDSCLGLCCSLFLSNSPFSYISTHLFWKAFFFSTVIGLINHETGPRITFTF